jgi:two-component system chemotaxis response regulator CheY
MSSILSIDDSAQIRHIVQGATEMIGYDFLGAPDGESGLEMLAEHHEDIALITLDVNMPGINGFEVLKRLKDDERFASIPVIMVTTESERKLIIDAIKTGAANYITKPFAQEELATKMVESLGGGI